MFHAHFYLLDVITALFLPGIVGWAFLVVVVLVEQLLISRKLAGTRSEPSVVKAVLFSNLATTFLGMVFFSHGMHMGHLVSWLPIDEYHGRWRYDHLGFVFVVSFIGSVLVESAINAVMLRKLVAGNWMRVTKATLLANVITYAIAALIVALFLLLAPGAFTD